MAGGGGGAPDALDEGELDMHVDVVGMGSSAVTARTKVEYTHADSVICWLILKACSFALPQNVVNVFLPWSASFALRTSNSPSQSPPARGPVDRPHATHKFSVSSSSSSLCLSPMPWSCHLSLSPTSIPAGLNCGPPPLPPPPPCAPARFDRGTYAW